MFKKKKRPLKGGNDNGGHVVSMSNLLASPQTYFGPAFVYEEYDMTGSLVRVLLVDGVQQSATYVKDRHFELVFAYTRAYDLMFAAGLPLRRVCMIGGGGYSYPKYLTSHHPEIGLDVVELDEAITEVALEFFFLDELLEQLEAEGSDRLRLVCADGRAHLAAHPHEYDAVLNDGFAGGCPAPSLTTVEAARVARSSLVPGGLYLSNAVCSLEGPDSGFLKAEVNTLRQVFSHVHVVPCERFDDPSVRGNAMIIATEGEYAFAGEVRIDCAGAPVLTDACNPLEEIVTW